MKLALLDGDIMIYELGFASETGWKAVMGRDDALPPFDYVEQLLNRRIEYIVDQCGADDYKILITDETETFRYKVATVKPYKGSRKDSKPWHYKNLRVYLRDVLQAQVVSHIEADDQLAIDQNTLPLDTIICTRDKDLKQVPGWFYSWELGQQPSFGPVEIDKAGTLELDRENGLKLTGTGYKWFAAQCLIGDTVDNIPGLPRCGPVKAYEILKDTTEPEEMEDAVLKAYEEVYGQEAEERLTEQATLCWIVRRYKDDIPEYWHFGLYE